VLGNVVAHVRLDPEGRQARQSLAAGFFAPTHSRLRVTMPGSTPVRALSPQSGLILGPGRMPIATSAEPPFHVLSGRDTQVEFAAGQWATRSVVLDRSLGDEVGGVTARLGIEDGLVKGTLRNDTPYLLEDAAVVVGQSLTKLGRLAPGQTAFVVLDPGSGPSSHFKGEAPLSYRLLGQPVDETATGGVGMSAVAHGVSGASRVVTVPMAAPPVQAVPPPVQPPPAPPAPAGQSAPTPTATSAPTPAPTAPPPAAPPPPPPASTPAPAVHAIRPAVLPPAPPFMPERLELPRDPEVQRRARLLESVINRPRPGPWGGQILPLTFLAFTRAQVGAGSPSVGDHPTYHLALLEQSLRLEPGPGPFTVPASLTLAEVLAQATQGMGGGSNGTLYWVELHGGSVTYGFRPPLPPTARIDALLVSTQQMGPAQPLQQGRGAPTPPNLNPGPAEAGVFSIYNWQSAAWDPLPSGQEQARVQPATAYVGPDGLVKVQVSAGSDRLLRFIQPELAVEGTVVAP
jgi:hypothetical protein